MQFRPVLCSEWTDGNLIGNKTATDLGLLHIVNSVQESKVNSIMEEYKDCRVGKDITAKLHFDSSVRPELPRNTADQHATFVEVQTELTNLQKLEIIESAEGPTSWVSPIVVAPKKTGIRICVNMRAANQDKERERHAVPTVQDLVDLNGTVFRKIALNQGYHRLELQEVFRSMTTFAYFDMNGSVVKLIRQRKSFRSLQKKH